jgi:hypothetical protein
MKTLSEYEKQKMKEIRKVMFDCAPLILALTGMIITIL